MACIGIVAIEPAIGLRLACFVDLARVERAALLGIVQERVSGGDILEPVLGFLVARIEVRMVLFRKLLVRLANVLPGRGFLHAERLVGVSHNRRFVSVN